MAKKLTFTRGQNKEGIEWTVLDESVDPATPIDVSTATEIEYRCHTQDFTTLLFEGSLTGTEIAVSGGDNNIVTFSPDSGDMDIDPGVYLSEWKVTFADGKIGFFKEPEIEIVQSAPTS